MTRKYVWWATAGGLCGFGIAGILTIGVAFLALGVAMVVAGALLPAFRNRSALAVPAGLAMAPLYLAWLNRDGPGPVCRTADAASACVDQWSPWPFLGLALVLVTTSVVLLRRAVPARG